MYRMRKLIYIYRVGSLYKTNAKFYTTKNLCWPDEDIPTLGMYFACDGKPVVKNFDDIYCKLEQVCDLWINRTSNLLGKVTIINSLMASLFIYKMNVMLDLDD